MAYERVIPIVDVTARLLSNALTQDSTAYSAPSRPADQPAAQPGARARDRQAGHPPLPLGRRPARRPGRPRRRAARGGRGRPGLEAVRGAPPAVIHSYSGPARLRARGQRPRPASASPASSSGAVRRRRPMWPPVVPADRSSSNRFAVPVAAGRAALAQPPEWVRVTAAWAGGSPRVDPRRLGPTSSPPMTGHSQAPGGPHDTRPTRPVPVVARDPVLAAVTVVLAAVVVCLRGVEPAPRRASAPSATASAPPVRDAGHVVDARHDRPDAPPTPRRPAKCPEPQTGRCPRIASPISGSRPRRPPTGSRSCSERRPCPDRRGRRWAPTPPRRPTRRRGSGADRSGRLRRLVGFRPMSLQNDAGQETYGGRRDQARSPGASSRPSSSTPRRAASAGMSDMTAAAAWRSR